MPLVLQLYCLHHTESLDDPYIATPSEITNYHSDVYVGSCYFGYFFDFWLTWLVYLPISRAEGPYMYNLSYAYTYAPSSMRRITLVLMHILIQAPSSYTSSFSYKTSDSAETHDPSPHATHPPLATFRSKSISLWVLTNKYRPNKVHVNRRPVPH